MPLVNKTGLKVDLNGIESGKTPAQLYMETTFGSAVLSPVTTISQGDGRDFQQDSTNSRDSVFSHGGAGASYSNSNTLQIRAPNRSESRNSHLSNLSFNDESEEEVVLFIEEPNKKLSCPLCKTIFKDPVITACGHTFCRKCVSHKRYEICPIDNQPLSVIVANIALSEQIGELFIYCKYGCKLADDGVTWELNPNGCPATIRHGVRHEHESVCDYAPVQCPNDINCPLLIKREYEDHVKNCNRARCHHSKFGCQFSGTRDELEGHLETCKFESMKEYLQKTDDKIRELQFTVAQKDQDIGFLRSMLGKLMERLERLEQNVELKIDVVGDSIKNLGSEMENLAQEQQLLNEDMDQIKNRLMELPPGGDYVPQQTWKCRGTFVGHKGPVWCLCAHGDYLFSGSSDNSVKVWDTATNYKCVKTLQEHEGIVLAVCVYGNKVFSGSQDTTIVVWNLDDFEKVKSIPAHDNPVCTLAAARNMIFSGSLKIVKVWDVNTHELKQEITGLNHWVRALQTTQNHLYCGSYQTIKILNLETLECIRELEITGGSVYSIVVTNYHVLCGTYDSVIHVWELSSYQKVITLTGHSGTVYALAAVSDASRTKVFSASYDRTLRVWSMENMVCMQTLDRHQGSVACLAVSRGRVFSGSVDSTVKVWQ